MQPEKKPLRPNFSSGPCAKRPGYDVSNLRTETLGRSHRSALGKKALRDAIEQTKAILKIPAGYKVGIVPASDTGAMEMAMWSLLGERAVDVFAWESFDQKKDIVFTWNGTTSGVKVPNGDWISDDREGLTICDATSAVFAMPMPWEKLDVTTFSWQKVLGGEGGHGVLILSPRAVARLESYTPSWPMPKIFRLTKAGKLIEGIFTGATINTPSMLAVADYLDALNWIEEIGGLEAAIKKSESNLAVISDFVAANEWINFLAQEEKERSNTSVCLILNLKADKIKELIKLLADENAALDIGAYRDAPAGLRIWCGATVEKSDLEALMPWIDWAYNQVK